MQKVLLKPSGNSQMVHTSAMCRPIKTFAGLGVMVLFMQTSAVCAQSNANIFIEQERRDAERASQQRTQQERTPDVKLPTASPASVGLLPADESPCFKIDLVTLSAGRDSGPKELLDAVGKTASGATDSPLGRCLGAKGVQVVIDRLQNELIAKGFVTSRVLAKPQNLQNGTLALELILGKINSVQWAPSAPAQMRRATQWNILPMSTGDVLNLRDIEQALENYKRVPTAEADIQIAPGTEPGSSDLIISHQQPMPFRLSATADDSGTRSTGKYQGSLTFSYDNWLNLSDLFYVTMLHDLGGADPGQRGTRGHIVHYSVPFGYWLMGLTSSSNQYHQTVAGANQDYLYSGTSRNMEAKLSRVLQRDAVGKTSISLKGFQRSSNNYIDDAEVEVQRRVVSGLEWGLNHRRSWNGGSLDTNLNYRRGTGAWGSLPAPEEAFGEGTSHMKLWLLDATVQQAFPVGGQPNTTTVLTNTDAIVNSLNNDPSMPKTAQGNVVMEVPGRANPELQNWIITNTKEGVGYIPGQSPYINSNAALNGPVQTTVNVNAPTAKWANGDFNSAAGMPADKTGAAKVPDGSYGVGLYTPVGGGEIEVEVKNNEAIGGKVGIGAGVGGHLNLGTKKVGAEQLLGPVGGGKSDPILETNPQNPATVRVGTSITAGAGLGTVGAEASLTAGVDGDGKSTQTFTNASVGNLTVSPVLPKIQGEIKINVLEISVKAPQEPAK